MKKIFYILLMMLSCNVFANDIKKTESIITPYEQMNEFDYPFLLGKWSSERKYDDKGNVFFLQMFVASDNSYSMVYFINNSIVNYDAGMFDYGDEQIKLSSITGKETVYDYEMTNNNFKLGEIPFIKLPNMDIIGNWKGIKIEDQLVNVETLTLYPNFLFSVQFKDKNGKSKSESGVYVIEKERIMFLYPDGKNIGTYAIEDELLNIDLENGDLLISMEKQELP